ncbi:hypothetical protein [Bacillus sp. CECT 9360]|uniref:hypothetical protein n=1 Tax=Bacillus sp. CECT 9360 TaxID=2845821 RepID=UPI001E44FEEF|nr:hypothetical protein [Bacillus sp. CECT 9360]CAH0347420.1 hypothetical protein BCI9360_03816 [Bacillus sp. CECT 9360]
MSGNLLKLLTIVLCVSIGYNSAAAQENSKSDEQTVVTNKHDVTGDGKLDSVSIEGVLYESESLFLKKIKLVVKVAKGKKIEVPLDAGYEPKLEFADFNRDGVDDVFITIPTGSSGGIINSYAYTFTGEKAVDLTVPPPVEINGQFLDNYKVNLSIPFQKTLFLDVSERKKDYERIGLYQPNGKLNEPTEVMVDPYSLLRIFDSKNSGKGLRGTQRVSGAYHADALADVYSEWEYQDGKWELVGTRTKTHIEKNSKE